MLFIRNYSKIFCQGTLIEKGSSISTKGNAMKKKPYEQKMYKEKSGVIINISSTNGLNTYYPLSVDYDASKSGLISLTYDSAVEFAPYVRVNCIAPGWVNTEMNKDLEENFKKEESERILVKRFGEPGEIANVVYFLASKEASFINSEVIKVDGGWY